MPRANLVRLMMKQRFRHKKYRQRKKPRNPKYAGWVRHPGSQGPKARWRKYAPQRKR